jgi:hypothetical protein
LADEQLERKNTTKMNKVESTPVEKRNKEHQEKLGACKDMNDELNGQERI